MSQLKITELKGITNTYMTENYGQLELPARNARMDSKKLKKTGIQDIVRIQYT